jgi:hypothetical protein
MAVVVTSAVHQTGSEISGDIAEIVVVRTNAGYRPNPGHAAGGTVVAVICGGSGVSPAVQPPDPQRPGSPTGAAPGAATGAASTATAAACRVSGHGRSKAPRHAGCIRSTGR